MSRCLLEQTAIERVLDGGLSPRERLLLSQHLCEDCRTCEQILDAAGLDEVSLGLLLGAPDLRAQDRARVLALWPRVQRALLPPLVRFERRALLGSFMALAAAALVVIVWPKPVAEHHAGIKGVAAPPTVELLIPGLTPACVPDGTMVELGYRLDREAYLALYHQRDGEPAELLYWGETRSPPSAAGQLEVSSGHLGYRFDAEPGAHRFVLLASDVRLTPKEVDAALSHGPKEDGEAAQIGGRRVGHSVARACALGDGG